MASVSQNAAFMAAASVVQRLISFVYFTVVAHMVGDTNLGKYGVALSTASIFVVFIDLGLTNVLIRNSAQDKAATQKNLGTVLGAKLFSGVLSYLGLIVFATLLGYDLSLMILIVVAGFTMLNDSLHQSFYGALRAHGILKWESYGIVMSQLITLVLGTVFLLFKLPLVFLMLAYLVPSLLNAVYAGMLVKKRLKISLRPQVSKPEILRMLKLSFPFALAAIFARLYANADLLLIKQLLGDQASGWYQVPYKIVYAFQFIPLAMVAALYPRFSEDFMYNKERLSITFERSIVYLLLISLPIAGGIYVLAPDIIFTFFPKYMASIVPLKMLIFSIIFSFVSFPIGSLLNACHKQMHQTAIVGIAMVANIIADIILIPRLGVVGAAYGALIGSVLFFVCGVVAAKGLVAIAPGRLLWKGIRLVAATLLMATIAFFVNKQAPFPIAALSGAVSYFTLLFALRIVTWQELLTLRALFHNTSS